MRTTDALKIGMALGRIRGAMDAWEESKHPRADNGQFTSGAGGGGGSKTSTKGAAKPAGNKVKELQRKSDELGKKLRRTYTHLSDSEKKTVNKAFEAARNGDAAEVKSLLKIDRDDAEHLTDLIKATDDHKQGQDIAAAVFISQAFPTWYHKPGEKVNKAEMVTNMFKQEKKEAEARRAASTKPASSKWKKASQEYKDNVNNMIYGVEAGGDIEEIAENDFNSPKGSKRYKEIMKIAKAYKDKKMSKSEAREALMGHYMDAWKGV